MKANGQENTAAYKDLSNEINNIKDRLAELKPEQDKNIEATKSQSDVSRQLINDIKITEASLEAMKNRLAVRWKPLGKKIPKAIKICLTKSGKPQINLTY